MKYSKIKILTIVSGMFMHINVYAQPPEDGGQNNNLSSSEFMTTIDGSITPYLINDAIVYDHLSSILFNGGPQNCVERDSDITEPGFSTSSPCISIEGVDSRRSALLAEGYIQYSSQLNESSSASFCSDANREIYEYIGNSEFSLILEAESEEVDKNRAEYFIESGEEIIGMSEMSILLDWADRNIRPTMKVNKIDFQVMLDMNNISSANYLEQVCKYL